LCLIAVLAAWVGAGFVVFRMNAAELPSALPVPRTMGYSFGHQPYGMVTSWLTWLAAFALLAPVATAPRRTRWRVLAATGVIGAIAGLAVTAGTFVQFDPDTAPRSEVWMWFAQWLVPQDWTDPDLANQGAYSFYSARGIYEFVSSYPHVLLAIAAFGVTLLLANRRHPALVANGFGIESSSNRV
jgi:hypothetical protein